MSGANTRSNVNVFVVDDNEEVFAISCLTTISRFAGWHLTTDGEHSLTSFPFRGLQSQNNINIIMRYQFGAHTKELVARWSNECLETQLHVHIHAVYL